jgi:transcriptional regulator with XRE-family HTH domain
MSAILAVSYLDIAKECGSIGNMREFYVEVGGRLREKRQQASLSQAELAQRVGLSRTSITNIERGHQQISLHLFLSLAAAVGANPWDLVPEAVDVSTTESLPEGLLEGLTQRDQDWVLRVVTKQDEPGGSNHGKG